MTSAHFKCENRLGISAIKHPEYESRAWAISEEDARKLVGGKIYFHQTKNELSYFGGTVKSYRIEKTENAREDRIIFTLISEPESKGITWAGRSDVNAHYSGVLD